METLSEGLTFTDSAYWTENIQLKRIYTKTVTTPFRFVKGTGTGSMFHITAESLRMGVYNGGCGLYFENVEILNSQFRNIHIGLVEDNTRGIRFMGTSCAMNGAQFASVNIDSSVGTPSNTIGIEFDNNSDAGGPPVAFPSLRLTRNFDVKIVNSYSVPFRMRGNNGYSTGTGSQQTIAHGCPFTPSVSDVFLSERTTGDALAYQSAAPDATNIYVMATNAKDYN